MRPQADAKFEATLGQREYEESASWIAASDTLFA
jgi:hypothetical protein